MKRFFVSAIHKSSGKTTISIGLAAALAARGHGVQTFKKGPDYIDPMWLARASGRPCYNVDFNTQTPAEIVSSVVREMAGADCALIEGNKGLHDGVDPRGGDSSAALAKLLDAPVVLVVDVAGMARGIAPLMLGYKAFDPDVRIAGVILNKVGVARQETKLRQALETYTDMRVLGAIGREEGLNVDERHLGLTPPGEAPHADALVFRARDAVVKGVDLDAVLALAGRSELTAAPILRRVDARDVTIAVARDAAFGFYYADDFAALERAGARLAFFDTLRDQKLPDCDGLFIGGGFPETQAAALEANAALRENIRARLAEGLPAYAECGGLMYLSRSIEWNGERHAMVGAVPADAVMGKKPQGRGLVRLEETADCPWPNAGGEVVNAHEFHYAGLENLDPGLRYAWRVKRGHGVDGRRDGIVIGNLMASFAHLRDTQRCRWAERFVSFIRQRVAQARPAPPRERGLRAEGRVA